MDFYTQKVRFDQILSENGHLQNISDIPPQSTPSLPTEETFKPASLVARQLLQLTLISNEFDKEFFQKFMRQVIEGISGFSSGVPSSKKALHMLLQAIKASDLFVNFDIFLASLGNQIKEEFIEFRRVIDKTPIRISCKYLDLYRALDSFLGSSKFSYLMPLVQCILLIPISSFESAIFISTVITLSLTQNATLNGLLASTDSCRILGSENDKEFVFSSFEIARYIGYKNGLLHDLNNHISCISQSLRSSDILTVNSKNSAQIFPTHQSKSVGHDARICDMRLPLPIQDQIWYFPTSLLLEEDLRIHLNRTSSAIIDESVLRSVKILLASEILSSYQTENFLQRRARSDCKSFWTLMKVLKGAQYCDSLLTKHNSSNIAWQIDAFHNEIRCSEGYSYERILKEYNTLTEISGGNCKIRIALARYLDHLSHSKSLSPDLWRRCIIEYSVSACSYTRLKSPIVARILTMIVELTKSNYSGLQDLVCEVMDLASKFIPYHVRHYI